MDTNSHKIGKKMKQILRVLLHLSPIVPLAMNYRYGAVALALLVGLCYVKVFKLRQEAIDSAAKGNSQREASVRKLLGFWQGLTFLGRE